METALWFLLLKPTPLEQGHTAVFLHNILRKGFVEGSSTKKIKKATKILAETRKAVQKTPCAETKRTEITSFIFLSKIIGKFKFEKSDKLNVPPETLQLYTVIIMNKYMKNWVSLRELFITCSKTKDFSKMNSLRTKGLSDG